MGGGGGKNKEGRYYPSALKRTMLPHGSEHMGRRNTEAAGHSSHTGRALM